MSVVESIVSQYDLPDIRGLEFLGGAGGFSGARIWKIQTRNSDFCLRCWPHGHPDRQQLEWINRVLVHAFHNHCPFVPVPRETRAGRRFVEHDQRFWEISPWMPGIADFEVQPTQPRFENVIESLARFHQASAQVNFDFRKSENTVARWKQLQQAEMLIGQIERAEPTSNEASILALRQMVLKQGVRRARELAQAIEPFTQEVFPVQPVIRDVWHDHLLFTGNKVSGIVDFGAMQIDHIALDISRVLGSLVGEPTDAVENRRWQAGLEVYSRIRPLQPLEIELVSILDQSATLLGSLNWLKWILIERREFESGKDVERRLRHLIARQI